MTWLLLSALLMGCPRGGTVDTPSDSADSDTPVDTDVEDTDTDVDTDDTDTNTSADPRDLCGTDCTTCLPLPDAQGNLYCADPVDPYRESCAVDSGQFDESDCCDDDECGERAQCAAESWNYCGGVAPRAINHCLQPECAKSSDCDSGEACIPAGGLGFAVATCVQAPCSADSDCTAGTEGQCTLMGGGLCGDSRSFACTYAEDPCRTDADCTTGNANVCRLKNDGGTECVEEQLPA